MSLLNKPVKPYTFVDGVGNVAYGSQVNADFDILYNKVGDMVDVINTTNYQAIIDSVTAAEDAQLAAEAAKAAAELALDSFDDRYLGVKSSDPTLDNDSNALVIGALYFNSVIHVMRVYNGSSWQDNNALSDGSVTNAKLAFDGGALSGFRNAIINGNFGVNQRVYASGAAVGSLLYGHDRWKMAASGDTYTFSTANNVTTVTIPAGKVLQQVIEGINLQSGTYVLSWTGTAQGKIGAGSYGASGITGTATGGTNLTIEFGHGTVSKVQFEFGSVATPFEARPYGTELALCQRYLPVLENQHGVLTGHCYSTTAALLLATFPVTARVAPTGITYANINAWSVRSSAGGAVQLATLTFGTASKDHAQLACTVSGGLVAGDGTSSYNNGGAGYLYFTGCEL